MSYETRWDMILEGMLGAPATPEQKALFENGVGMAYVMYSGPQGWDSYTVEQKAEACVNHTHQHHVGLSKQYEYNKSMQAAADTAKSIEDDLAQVDAPSTLVKTPMNPAPPPPPVRQ